jgi:HEAT repeat protein
MALSQVHDEPSLVVPALVKALGDTNANVRGVAVVGLKGIGWSGAARQAVPALELLLSDPDGQVRRAAVDALKQIDPEAAAKAGVK